MSELRLLRPEEWQIFREDQKHCSISYWDTTERWATARGLRVRGVEFSVAFNALKGAAKGIIVLALIGVPVALWRGQFGPAIGAIGVGALGGALVGAVKGYELAFKRSFVSWLLSDESIYVAAINSSGIDIWYHPDDVYPLM